MAILSNQLESTDKGDSYEFKFKFASDSCTLPAEVCEKTFTIKKPETFLAEAKKEYEAELAKAEVAQIALEAAEKTSQDAPAASSAGEADQAETTTEE